MGKHFNKNPNNFKYTCPECNMPIQSMSNMDMHMRYKHKPEEELEKERSKEVYARCGICKTMVKYRHKYCGGCGGEPDWDKWESRQSEKQ